MVQRPWRRLQCRLRGHTWVSAEIPGFRPDGSTFTRERRVRLCVRCQVKAREHLTAT